jgi:hypothetical protein
VRHDVDASDGIELPVGDGKGSILKFHPFSVGHCNDRYWINTIPRWGRHPSW